MWFNHHLSIHRYLDLLMLTLLWLTWKEPFLHPKKVISLLTIRTQQVIQVTAFHPTAQYQYNQICYVSQTLYAAAKACKQCSSGSHFLMPSSVYEMFISTRKWTFLLWRMGNWTVAYLPPYVDYILYQHTVSAVIRVPLQDTSKYSLFKCLHPVLSYSALTVIHRQLLLVIKSLLWSFSWL